MNTSDTTTTAEHSRLAGLRNRLDSIIESAETARAYLDDRKKWRNVASYINDIQADAETAEQQISELL